MSSDSWPKTFSESGIYSTDCLVNPFCNWNKVFVKYCSSDAWAGNASALGYKFHGHAIVREVFTALLNDFGMNESSHVVISGCSAGARGAMLNMDFVGQMLPKSVKFGGLVDSAWWVEDSAMKSYIRGLFEITKIAVQLHNTVIAPSCALAHPGEEWRCLIAASALPHYSTPYITQAFQFDRFQV
jgi:hypothetical protein